MPQWKNAPPALAAILTEAARKQKYIFDGMLHDAAKHFLDGAQIPSRDVDLGKLGLRYRRETQGEIGSVLALRCNLTSSYPASS